VGLALHLLTTQPNFLSASAQQELVDCDTDQDKGCRGGLMDNAYNYIIENKVGQLFVLGRLCWWTEGICQPGRPPT
jgi:hypothetical protein